MSGMPGKPGSSGWLTLPAGDSTRAWQPYSATARSQPHFEAFRQLEAAGQYDQAFSSLQAGNRIKDEALDGAGDVRRQAAAAGALRSLYTAAFLRDQSAATAAHAPIFIIGMPRSGSTLVEQILASHPQVQPLGETGDVSAIAARTSPYGGSEGFDPGRMAEQYLGAARARGWDGARRLVTPTAACEMRCSARDCSTAVDGCCASAVP